MQEDVVHGKRVQFQRSPKYAPGTDKLAADGRNGLAHHTEFRRPDGRWVAIRYNVITTKYIWVVYSIAKTQIGATRIPLRLLEREEGSPSQGE